MDYDKVKQTRSEYLNGAHYEKEMNIKVKLLISEINTTMEFEHDINFIQKFDDYVNTAKTLGDITIIGPGGEYPITLAEKVLFGLKLINYKLYKELFIKQNDVELINRDDFNTDEEFELAINSVIWEFDITQTFTY